jgi:iron complex outermembrane receptor protein
MTDRANPPDARPNTDRLAMERETHRAQREGGPLAYILQGILVSLAVWAGSFSLAVPAAATDLNREFKFNIPQQPLAEALADFSRQSDVIIIAPSELTAGKLSKPVNATTTPAKALKQLLEGSSLVYTQENDGSIVVRLSLKTSVRETNPPPIPSDAAVTPPFSNSRQEQAIPEPSSDNLQNKFTLQEVIVTARKRGENIQTVPLAVTALSGATLEQNGIRQIYDLQGQVPNLFLQRAVDDPQSLTFEMRGQKQNDVTLGVDPSVGLYIDGLYYPRTHGMRGALVDVDRVEVLRGPQGTLYGRNTTGGALSVYTKNPTDEFGASLDVSGGNYSARSVIGIANVPLTANFSARFVIQHGTHDGYGRDSVGDELNSEDTSLYRVKLRGQITDNVSAIFSASYQYDTTGGPISKLTGLAAPDPAAGLPAGGPATLETALETGKTVAEAAAYLQSFIHAGAADFYDSFSAVPSYSHVTRESVGLDVTTNLAGDLKFRSITGFEHLDRLSFFGNPIPVNLLNSLNITHDNYYSQEFQFLGGTSPFTWVAGLYGSYERGLEYANQVVFPDLTNSVPFAQIPIVINGSLAPYAQGVWEFAPRWRLTAGARYSWDRREATMMSTNGGVCAVPAPGVESTLLGASQCPRTYSDDFASPNWLISIDHRLTDGVFAYVKFATGYRSGGQQIGGAFESETFLPFAPETVKEYEAGVKLELLEEKLQINLAGYFDDYKGIQRSVNFMTADGSFSSRVENAAAGSVDGFEIEAHLRATPHLTLNFDGSLTNTAYRRYVDLSGDHSHDSFGVPKWMFGVSGQYVQPLAVGSLALNIDYYWRSTTVLAPAAITLSTVTQDSYGILNSQLTLKLDRPKVEIALFCENLTARRYLDSALAEESGAGVNYAYVGDPRTFGVEVTKRFGAL